MDSSPPSVRRSRTWSLTGISVIATFGEKLRLHGYSDPIIKRPRSGSNASLENEDPPASPTSPTSPGAQESPNAGFVTTEFTPNFVSILSSPF